MAKSLATAFFAAAAHAAPPQPSVPNGLGDRLRRSVVKIYVTIQRPNHHMPWQAGAPSSGTGSGFVIKGKRILTNAHIVSDARFIEVQRDGDPRRVRARVDYAAHDCDLAMLTTEDPEFLADTTPMQIAHALPHLNDDVMVLGYPTGGVRLSVTRGVVSRIDYSIYSHSGVDQHLVLQVDAAINPGNSGGPILYRGKVVGLAFQGMAWAENIGYAIPIPVIDHFLRDVEDGVYHGYPELGVAFLDARNPALRRSLGIPSNTTGVVVSYIDPFGCARGTLQTQDILLSIDGHAIANDGTVVLDGNTVIFNELLERKQWGESVDFAILRSNRREAVTVPLTNPTDPFAFRNEYDTPSRYHIFAGLVFAPLTRGYLRTLNRSPSTSNDQQLFYYSRYAKVDGLHQDRDDFVVLARRLPHAVNTYTDRFMRGIVTRVNDRPVHCLADLRDGLALAGRRFHVIEFAGVDETLVLDGRLAGKANSEILERYGVPVQSSIGEKK